MKLQGRELRRTMQGPDVALLQFELSVLAAAQMPIPLISEAELYKSTFDSSTEDAVLAFQSWRGLDKTGVVDDQTAPHINEMIREASHEVILEQVWSALKRLHERIASGNGDPDLRREIELLREQIAMLQRELDRAHEAAGASDTRMAELNNLLAGAQARIQELVALLDKANSGVNIVSGMVQRAGRLPARSVQVKAYHREAAEHGRSLLLGETTTDVNGLYTIRYEPLLQIPRINLLVAVVDEAGLSLVMSDLRPNPDAFETIDLMLPDAMPQAPLRRVEGRVVYQNGLPVAASALTLRLYRARFGGVRELLAQDDTRDNGLYTLTFNADSSAASLIIFAVPDGGEETQLSKQLTYPRNAERIVADLVVPGRAQAQGSEYARLTADLTAHTGEIDNLRNAKENDKIQDITVLHQATGWDARLIGLAALGERLRHGDENQLPQEAVYGMLRAGLPSDKLLLAQMHPDVVASALQAASKAGIVAYDDTAIQEIKTQFADFADKTRMALPVPGSHATYASMLSLAGLDPDQSKAFAREYLNHQGDTRQFWTNAKEKVGLDDAAIARLQLQGKLALLAGNSEPVLKHLLDKGLADPADLIAHDLYTPEAWVAELNALAAATGTSLQELIPPTYAGEPQERLDAYAGDMARKLRLSYPTHVVGHLIAKDNADHYSLGGDKDATVTLLQSATKQGFRLGQTPVTTFLRDHPGVGADMTVDVRSVAQKHMTALQRVYQITTSNEAIPVLMSLNMASAYDVTAYTEDEFSRIYAKKYVEYFGSPPAPEKSHIIYRKAQQVSSMSYNLFAVTKKLDTEPNVPALGGSSNVRDEVRQSLIKQLPTLESLFGSMDFCECEHCRSILSPAAYLVDLLQFVDPDDAVWENKIAVWSEQHNGKPYPHTNKDGHALKPYDALVERRPDLPYIPLTCENTNTALPYIDVVNEILEYYVANDRLTNDAAKDTGDASSAELIAEPQNVTPAAYDKVGEAHYPLTLPFDPWIETVRQFCQYYETPLATLLEVFRPTDMLFAPTLPYDRSAIFLESLGIGPLERNILFDPDPLAGDAWHGLYGLPVQRPAIKNATNAVNASVAVADADTADFREGMICSYMDVSAGALHGESMVITTIDVPGSGGPGQTTITFTGVWTTPPDVDDLLVCLGARTLQSAKALSRRLGVTYQEIVDIVQTGFVNPRLTQLAILYKLGVSIYAANLYRAHKNLLARDPATLSDEEKMWLPDVQAFDVRLGQLAATYHTSRTVLEDTIDAIPYNAVLTLADPDAGCNFDETTLEYADGTAVDPVDLLRINMFVRLWRKLGWTIEETDRALQAFVPKNAPFDADHLADRPLLTALIYLAHFSALDKKLPLGKQSRLKWSTLWLPIPTTGKNSLYARLFLNRSVLKSGEFEIVVGDQTKRLSVFDDPLGRYLDPGVLASLGEQVRFEVHKTDVADADELDPAIFNGHDRIAVRYDTLSEVQYLSYVGMLSDADKGILAGLTNSAILNTLLDAVQVAGKEFTLLKSHLLALQGALSLSANDIRLILDDAGLALESDDVDEAHPNRAELSLAHVSLLYRYGLLAKALKLPMRDMLALKQMSGLDPFAPLSEDPLPGAADADPSALERDHPYTQTLGFVEVAEQVQASDLSIDDLDYLLRHRFDATGTYRPDRAAIQALLKSLAEGVRAIRAEHVVPDDPGAFSDEVLRQKLGLVLPAAIADTFVAMLNGTVEYTVSLPNVAPADALDPASLTAERAIRRVEFNGAAQTQRLTFRGVLLETANQELKDTLPMPTPGAAHVPSPVLNALLDEVQAQAQAFFDTHLLGGPLTADTSTGFLAAADFALLFTPLQDIPSDATEAEQQALKNANDELVRQKRQRLANAFVPFLRQRLTRQFIVQTMTAATGAEPVLLESLLADKRLLARTQSMLDILAEVGQEGVSSSFFGVDELPSNIPATDTTVRDVVVQNSDHTTNSAQFRGYLEVPAAGAYRFFVRLAQTGAQATLLFEHLPEPQLWTHTATDAQKEFGGRPNEFLELKPGVLYAFRLDLAKLAGGRAEMDVQGETLSKGSLARLTLYSADRLRAAEGALLLLNKALRYVQGLGLNEREVRYLLTHAAQFDGFSLSDLPTPVDGSVADTTHVANNFKRFLRIAAYARLKAEVAGGTDGLIDVFEAHALVDAAAERAAASATEAGAGAAEIAASAASARAHKLDEAVYPRIAQLTRRDAGTVKMAARALAATPVFPNERPLQRLWEVLQVVERFGAPVAALLQWTGISANIAPGDATAPARRFTLAGDVKEVIKARYEPEAWQRIAQPIFDTLRQRQRDALVAYVMHQHGFARMEQLYEYFLIDPGMEPVVQTSRIRLAIASVQLFIQRCLLNLEPKVSPSMITAKHWEWMKRYRVWEANRKIFLFPENWLEPEFRDDKTHLFAELEGALLQGDVSRDLVEDAFLNYLKKLDELARLDIVGMHIENTLEMGSRIVHVIGRTYSQPHTYFYRQYSSGGWSPWEPVSVEIQGDHLAPIIWRDRLYLFWVTFLEKSDPSAATPADADLPDDELAKVKIAKLVSPLRSISAKRWIDVQLHWSERLRGQWSTAEAGPMLTTLTSVSSPFKPHEVFIHVDTRYDDDGSELGVNIHLGGAIRQSLYIAGRNSVPIWDAYSPEPDNPYGAEQVLANRYGGSDSLSVTYTQRITSEADTVPLVVSPHILNTTSDFTLLPSDNFVPPPGVPSQAFEGVDNQAVIELRLALARQELAELVKPVFYQDDRHTLFVEPSVDEQTLEDFQDWIIKTPQDPPTKVDPGIYEPPILIPVEPWPRWPNPGDPPWDWKYGDGSLINPVPGYDWLVNPATGVAFDGRVIGQAGWTGLQTAPITDIAQPSTIVSINQASSVPSGSAVFVSDQTAAATSGVKVPGGGFNVVGASGLNAGLADNFAAAAAVSFGERGIEGMSGIGR